MDYKLIGILVRLNDKIRRLESLIKKNSINYESIDDTILDSFNYIILALILLKI
jgi:superfamily I DNA/RNA helicase